MNIVESLKNDLEEQAKADAESNLGNFSEGELTEEEKARLEQLKAERDTELVVVETGADGSPVRSPVGEFIKELDERVATFNDEVKLKTVNAGDISASAEQVVADVRNHALEAYRSMSVRDAKEYTDDEYLEINNQALNVIKDHFGLTSLDTTVISRLNKLSLRDLVKILPDEFIDIYVTSTEILANNYRAKERLIATIGYLITTGPELDHLNEYIDSENRLYLVSKRILQCQMDFMEMIKDEKMISEIVAKTVQIAPADDTFWAKYIKVPNRLHNEFAQRAVIQQEYKKAYVALLDDPEYKDIPEAVRVINKEITEADTKTEIFQSITNLELMRELGERLADRYMHGTKLSHRFLLKEGVAAVDRARRCKQNLPFPGLRGDETRADVMFKRYMELYPKLIGEYNKIIIQILDKESKIDGTQTTNVEPIYLDGVSGDIVAKTFSLLLLILMGRILKKLSTTDATKYDAILLDSYFQLFCKLTSDIYTMTDVWAMMRPFVEAIINTVKFDQKW